MNHKIPFAGRSRGMKLNPSRLPGGLKVIRRFRKDEEAPTGEDAAPEATTSVAPEPDRVRHSSLRLVKPAAVDESPAPMEVPGGIISKNPSTKIPRIRSA